MILTTKLAQLASVHCASMPVPDCLCLCQCATCVHCPAEHQIQKWREIETSVQHASYQQNGHEISVQHSSKMSMKSASNTAKKWAEICVQQSNKMGWNLCPTQQQNRLKFASKTAAKLAWNERPAATKNPYPVASWNDETTECISKILCLAPFWNDEIRPADSRLHLSQ